LVPPILDELWDYRVDIVEQRASRCSNQMVSNTPTGGSGSPHFRGAAGPIFEGVWENALKPVRGVLDRPSAEGS
jgi:hypothetical protein